MTLLDTNALSPFDAPEAINRYFRDHQYPLPHRFTAIVPRMNREQRRALRASIDRDGFREPVLLYRGLVADGIERCIAAIELGWPWLRVPTKEFEGDEDSLMRLVLDGILSRKHLNESQRAMVAVRFADMAQGARTDLAQICAMSQTQAGDLLRVSRRLVQHAQVVRGGPRELINAADDGVLPVSFAAKVQNSGLPEGVLQNVLRAYDGNSRQLKVRLRNAMIDVEHSRIVAGARRHSLSRGRYSILIADPPWPGAVSRAADNPYPRLEIEALCDYRLDDGRLVRDAMADDAILYLWVIDQLLFQIERLLDSWGFKLKRTMSWPHVAMGFGTHVRLQHELCLLCTRGNFPIPEQGLGHSSLIAHPLADRMFRCADPHDGRHSSKPDLLYEMIERAYPRFFGADSIDQPMALELFARNYRARWDGQGFEYPGRPAVPHAA